MTVQLKESVLPSAKIVKCPDVTYNTKTYPALYPDPFSHCGEQCSGLPIRNTEA
jgi:hypothetical protein